MQTKPVVGIDTNPARLILCGLMWATPAQVLDALNTIGPDDFGTPHQEILQAIAELATRDITGAEAVMGELLRRGDYHGPVRREMETAPMAGGVIEGVRDYATSHLAQRFRDQSKAYAEAVAGMSETSAEHDLWQGIVDGGKELRRLAARLETLRGGQL